jgi:hypothetical protein
VRIVLLLFSGGAAFIEFVHWFSGDPLSWEHPTQRIGLSGKIAVAVLCMPFVYATPLFHYGVLQCSRTVDVAALAAECRLYEENRDKYLPPDKHYPFLQRLGVTYVRAQADGTYDLWDRARKVQYRVGPTSSHWELWIQCGSLSWRRVYAL